MKKCILVVEDEEKLRRVIELQLTSAGFEVEKASSAEEGLRRADRADLVLTDLRLPGMNGLELLAQIRRQNMHAPVIVMTAFGTVETAVEAMKCGANDFLMKPFSLDHPDGRRPEGARDAGAQRRKPRTAPGTVPSLPVRQHRGPQPADAGDFRDGRARGRQPREPCCSPGRAASART